MFKEMKEEDLLELLEGEVDILTPMVEADEKIYRDTLCPRCGGECSTDIDIETLFDVDPETMDIVPGPRMSNRAVPRKLSRCMQCGCLFDPFTGLLLEMGNLGRLEPLIPIIHND